MINKKICIDTVDKVKTLVGEATAVNFEVNILTESFTVNAKSILGIFSLNRTAPVELAIEADEDDEAVRGFLAGIEEYIVE